jgi:hypothetical protein
MVKNNREWVGNAVNQKKFFFSITHVSISHLNPHTYKHGYPTHNRLQTTLQTNSQHSSISKIIWPYHNKQESNMCSSFKICRLKYRDFKFFENRNLPLRLGFIRFVLWFRCRRLCLRLCLCLRLRLRLRLRTIIHFRSSLFLHLCLRLLLHLSLSIEIFWVMIGQMRVENQIHNL